MRIAVFVKQVPASLRVSMGEDGLLDRRGMETITNPADQTALVMAAQLKKQLGGEVLCFTMGPSQASICLREAAVAGADHLYHLCDNNLAGADTLITAKALTAALQKAGGAQLLLLGRHSVDGETGQVGPEMAAMLDMPCLTQVTEIVPMEDKGLKCTCMGGGGMEVYLVKPPAVLCVCESKRPAALPSLLSMRRAAAKEITTFTLKDIGLDALRGKEDSPTRVVEVKAKIPVKKHTRWLDGKEMDKAAQVIEDVIRSATGGEGS